MVEVEGIYVNDLGIEGGSNEVRDLVSWFLN